MFLERSVRCRYGALVEGSLFSLPAESLGLASVTFYHEGVAPDPEGFGRGMRKFGKLRLGRRPLRVEKGKGFDFSGILSL